jgi:hypothetical protein
MHPVHIDDKEQKEEQSRPLRSNALGERDRYKKDKASAIAEALLVIAVKACAHYNL